MVGLSLHGPRYADGWAVSRGRAVGQARHAFAPRVLAVLAVSFLTFAAMLAAITYLVPFLNQVTDVSGPIVSVFLLVYGAAERADRGR